MDLNHRPPGPEPGALARLRYAPTDHLGWNFPPKWDYKINTALALRIGCFIRSSRKSPAKQSFLFSRSQGSLVQQGPCPQKETAGKLSFHGGYCYGRVRSPQTNDQLLELVAQCELHHAWVGQQPSVIAKGGRNVQFGGNRLHVEAIRVSHVEDLPADLESLFLAPRHVEMLRQTHVDVEKAIAPDLVASARFAGEGRCE